MPGSTTRGNLTGSRLFMDETMREISPGRYFDEPYGPGRHVVLLHLDDDLYRRASRGVCRVEARTQGVRFWSMRVTRGDLGTVQACRFPQYRLFRDGSEVDSRVGLLDDDGLLGLIEEML